MPWHSCFYETIPLKEDWEGIRTLTPNQSNNTHIIKSCSVQKHKHGCIVNNIVIVLHWANQSSGDDLTRVGSSSPAWQQYNKTAPTIPFINVQLHTLNVTKLVCCTLFSITCVFLIYTYNCIIYFCPISLYIVLQAMTTTVFFTI